MKQRSKNHKLEASGFSFVFLFFCIFCFSPRISFAVDTITITDSIKDGGGDTIISSGGNFEMGFFSPGNSKHGYIGIWYKKIYPKTIVWVANREAPLMNSSGVLKVMKPGVLAILNDTNGIIWSTNSSRFVQNPIAQLLDSGNLVLKDANDDSPENFLWQSFDFPTDTLLPEMKFGWNFETGQEKYLRSWKSNDDPAPGEFTYHCDPTGYPQDVFRKGPILQYRAGPWNGLRFSGSPNSSQSPLYKIDLVYNKKEVYVTSSQDSKFISRFVLNQTGFAQRWTWADTTQEWVLYLTVPNDKCDSYKLCGPYGTCKIGNFPICDCLDRFVPKYPNNWIVADWGSGCVRKTPLECHKGDGFLKYSGLKLPDVRNSWYDGTLSLEECKLKCLKDCSCMAYANSDIRNGGSGCLLWFEELVDIREVTDGQDLYIRMASSEIAFFANQRKRSKLMIVTLSVLTGMLLLGLILAIYLKIWKTKHLKLKEKVHAVTHIGRQIQMDKLPQFDLVMITKATNNFSLENKLGEGGFGSVYKGVLEEGQEIAVKRLSKSSFQGLDEFKNEVSCISKLQHRNLVKLLGYCIEGEEKMLIYEYMHNSSLDSLIFDPRRGRLLDWPKRFHIINGIARGLLYLHHDSQLRIIHRDLKASNILLDKDMNPKISDFGLARIFRGNETGDKTGRVIGTYGYMSPEYAVLGIFSVKSDVFSFGVSVLEIVSGKRNKDFFHRDHHHNLIGHAWMLYKEGRSIELLDANLGNPFDSWEVLRCIHVGLLCLQQYPQDRPNIFSVVQMLSNNGDLPEPKRPGFFMETNVHDLAGSSSLTNDITITTLYPR